MRKSPSIPNLKISSLDDSSPRQSPSRLELVLNDGSPIRQSSTKLSSPPKFQLKLRIDQDDDEDEKISPTSEKQQLIDSIIKSSCSGKLNQKLMEIDTDDLVKIGSGNFGNVHEYKGQVLKTVRFSKFRPEEVFSCILDNIHFVKISDIAFNRFYYRVLMPFVEGITLQNLFKKYKLSFDQLAGIVFQFIEILSYLDSIQLLHNDLKPDNIILQKNGVIKVIDYSLLDKKYVFATEKYSAVGLAKDIKLKSYQSDKIWTDAWSLVKSIWTYFDSEFLYLFDGLPCEKHDMNNEQCTMLSEFIRICLDFDEPISVDILKSLEIYQYILSKGGIEFATSVLAPLL